MSKLLTVVGATGAQGGALIAHVLKHSKLSKIYKLRGITRDVTKPAAIALEEEGVEVVQVLVTNGLKQSGGSLTIESIGRYG
jgi:uncharacterized protein YbjT (DUF2867 family)